MATSTIDSSKENVSSVTACNFSRNEPNHPPISYVFPKRSKSRSCQHAGSVPGHGCIIMNKRILCYVPSVRQRCLKES